MTKEDERKYQDTARLRELICSLKGQKFKLDCGHHVTFGYHLGNDITIRNGAEPTIICSLCGY